MEWITAADISREAWRRLLELANLEFAEAAIERLHGSDPRQRANRRKQAANMRVALLQAREYFKAAELCSTYTSPNHLYYGMTSLASTILLLRGDGRCSFDFLRQDAKNRSHGLRFTTGVANKTSGSELLEESRVEVLTSGHFRNWYEVLPEKEPAVALVTREREDGTIATGIESVGEDGLSKFPALIGRSLRLLDCLCRLPDLRDDLFRAGFKTPGSRINHHIRYSKETRIDTWTLHGARTEEELDKILDEFYFSASAAGFVEVKRASGSTSAIVEARARQSSLGPAFF